MAERQKIRREGEKAEALFLQLVSGSTKSAVPKEGDAIVEVDSLESYVEVKHCDSDGGTINQVRAVKYICCAIWAPREDCWYVLSPDQLVTLAASKNRGHHNEIAFECMQFTLASLRPGLHEKCSNDDLKSTVHGAIRRGRKMPALKQVMDSLSKDITALNENYKARAHSALDPSADEAGE